jgi:hypothetical protein
VTDYLARLKARSSPCIRPQPFTLRTFKTHQSTQNIAIEGFEGALGTGFSLDMVPPMWGDALTRMDGGVPPRDVPPQRWSRFLDDWAQFLAGTWATKAAALGWQAHDLFGCDLHHPYARVDRLGLLWLINGGALLVMNAESATFKTFKTGSRLTYRRSLPNPTTINVWDLQNLQ